MINATPLPSTGSTPNLVSSPTAPIANNVSASTTSSPMTAPPTPPLVADVVGGTGSNEKLPKKGKKFNWKMLVGGLAVLVLTIGGVAAYTLSQQDQDVRQQASTTWSCNGITESNPQTQALFNNTWCDGEGRWKWQAAGDSGACGGNPSSPASQGCGGGGGTTTTTGPGCSQDSLTSVACRNRSPNEACENFPGFCRSGTGNGSDGKPLCACVPDAPLGNGMACTANSNCQSGYCNPTTRVCGPNPSPIVVATAAPVPTPTPRVTPTPIVQGSPNPGGTGGSSGSTCTASGESCTTSLGAAGFCRGGNSGAVTIFTCEKQVALGGSCTANFQCSTSYCDPNTSKCVTNTTYTSCTRTGQSCTTSLGAAGFCRGGTTSSGTIYTCEKQVASGGACSDDFQCTSGYCNPDTDKCGPRPSPIVVSTASPGARCGNGLCESSESNSSCPADCGGLANGERCNVTSDCDRGFICQATPYGKWCIQEVANSCGNGRCDINETIGTCPRDCNSTTGSQCGNFSTNCGPGLVCQNNMCVTTNTALCGNNVCDLGENKVTCERDCAPASGTGGGGGTGGTTPTAGGMCPNDATKPITKYIKFTCPNGCTYTTEGGVGAYRCYDVRQESTSPLFLTGDECGQVDALSGDSDATYCGYTQYNCNDPRCQRQASTPPGGQSSPTPPGPQCLSISMTVNGTAFSTSNSPVIGSTIQLTCGQVTGAARYIFRVTEPDGTAVSLTATGRTSANFNITKSGRHFAQCQICLSSADNSCYPFENTNQVSNTGPIQNKPSNTNNN